MNDGVAMLLERMKTNPEEFYSNVTGKWSHIINTYIMHLEKKDRDALNKGLDKVMQQRFTEEVMQEFVEPKSRLKTGAIPKGMFGEATVKAEGGTVSFS